MSRKDLGKPNRSEESGGVDALNAVVLDIAKLYGPETKPMTNKTASHEEILNNAHQEFVAATANALETLANDAALENLKQQRELFRAACDEAEEFVESVKKRSVLPLPPVDLDRLEHISKVVRCLAIDLQHAPGV